MRAISIFVLTAALFAFGTVAPAFAGCGAEHSTKTVEAPSTGQVAEKPDGK